MATRTSYLLKQIKQQIINKTYMLSSKYLFIDIYFNPKYVRISVTKFMKAFNKN